MLVDRSYLPYQSAREHQDRGMGKWMGFFLSEHTTALTKDKKSFDFSSQLSQTDKLLLTGQLYAQQVKAFFLVREKEQKVSYSGKITELSPEHLRLKDDHGQHHKIRIIDILTLSLENNT